MSRPPTSPTAFGVTTDLVVFTMHEGIWEVLLVRRSEDPYRGRLALPGGFVEADEDLEDAAYRELREEAGVEPHHVVLEQLRTYGTPGRDERMRVVTVAWLAFGADLPMPVAGVDVASAEWVPVDSVDPSTLAFDHGEILRDGVERCRAKLEYTNLATSFCDPEFTVAELRQVYERVWGVRLDPRNFHRKVTGVPGFLVESGQRTTRGGGRPAMIYRAGDQLRLHPPVMRPGS